MSAEEGADPARLAQDLIRCASVTPAEGGALRLLEETLSRAGFRVERPIFSEAGTPDVENLYARIGTTAPCLVFAGHTDVVPPGDAAAWKHDPFSGAIESGEIHGRGAVDMKGAIACMATAVVSFLSDRDWQHPGSIAFLITGDEEGPAVNGTVKLLDWARRRGERFDHCLLGEPTNPSALGQMMKIGRRGSLTGRLRVDGRQGHVAYPELAANPIPLMMRALSALTTSPLDTGTAQFSPSNLEITTIDVGNTATNLIPASATAVFNVRFNDLWTPESLKAELQQRLAQVDAEAKISLTFDPTNSLAFRTEPGAFTDLVANAVEAETGQRPALSTSGGTSDARFISQTCPVVEFGLVGRTMHQVDERVPVRDLETLTAIYRRVLDLYLPAAALQAR